MEVKYYSELISEEFYEKISALRIAKGIECFKYFEFVFVNSNECKCKNVCEKFLKTTKIDDEILCNITNIIVLGWGTWEKLGCRGDIFTNQKYTFIGIFDMEGNESTINIGCISLNSITLSPNFYFDTINVSSCNITILHNQFHEYLDRIISPIYKTLSSSLKNSIKPFFKLENKLTIDICPVYLCSSSVDHFQSTLDALKEIEQKISNHLEDTKFDPEIILKIKSSEIQF